MKHSPVCAFTAVVVYVVVASGLAGCRKPPPREHVRPIGSSAQAGTGGAGRAGTSGTSGTSSTSGTSGTAGSPRDAAVVLEDGAVIVPGADASTIDAASLPPTPDFTKPALLEAVADCALSQYRDFASRAADLRDATKRYAATLEAGDAADARTAWLSAMRSWQRAELMLFGPAAASMEPGGQGLRDQLYIYPLANPCLVDQQIVSESYTKASFATSLSSARGLSALEYLLFHADAANACHAALSINADGSWAALSATQLAQRRAAYAAQAAKDVYARASALVEAWDPAHGDFHAELRRAGDGSRVYALERDGFSAVSDALFYVDKQVKDWKVGWPLGWVAECIHAPSPCPDDVESRYARVSTDHLRQNLIGFRKLFEGCGPLHWGLGFDDWLRKQGSGALAEQMLDALDGAQTAVDELQPPLEQAVTTDPSALGVVHAKLKLLTDLLKTQFVSVLDLELPMSAQGDND
jgi:uncharacterized protein